MAREEDIILDVDVDVEGAVESIESLTKANKELREERKKLDINNAEQAKRIKEINARLDDNTDKIKANVSALEKQKINIGNYRSALDGVHPALGKVGAGLEQGTSGFKAMTVQALRFIATPIGAILAALVAVFSLLKSALSQNAELMDKFENITNAVGVVLEVIVARVGKLGEALIALVTGNFTEAVNLTAQAFGGLADEIANATRQQQLYLDASRDLEDAQRNLRLEQAKSVNQIKLLDQVAKNSNKTFDEREAALNKSIEIQKDLIDTSEDLARRDLLITARRLRVSKEFQQQSDETFDAYVDRLLSTSALGDAELDKLVDKAVALENARNSSLDLQQKTENDLAKIQNERAEAIKKQNAALAEQAALQRATQRAENIEDVSTDDPLVNAFTDRATVITDINDRMQTELAERNKQATLEQIQRARAAADLEIEIERQKGAAIGSILGSTASLFEQDSIAFKVLATAQATINTYLAATAALASGSKINPVYGYLSAAAAVVSGLASVAKINGVEFAEGGIVLRGRSHAQGGIPIVAEGNEIIMTKGVYNNPSLRAQASAINVAGGGRSFADGGLVSNSITAPINQQMEFMNIVKNLPPQEVSVKEINKVQRRVRVKEQLSKR